MAWSSFLTLADADHAKPLFRRALAHILGFLLLAPGTRVLGLGQRRLSSSRLLSRLLRCTLANRRFVRRLAVVAGGTAPVPRFCDYATLPGGFRA